MNVICIPTPPTLEDSFGGRLQGQEAKQDKYSYIHIVMHKLQLYLAYFFYIDECNCYENIEHNRFFF